MKKLFIAIALLNPIIGLSQNLSFPTDEEILNVISNEETSINNYETFLNTHSLLIDANVIDENKKEIKAIRYEISYYKTHGDSAILLVSLLSSIDDLTLSSSITRSDIITNGIGYLGKDKNKVSECIEAANLILKDQKLLLDSSVDLLQLTLKYVAVEELIISSKSSIKNNS